MAGTLKQTASGIRLDRAERRNVVALVQAERMNAVLCKELARWGCSTTDLPVCPMLCALTVLQLRRGTLSVRPLSTSEEFLL